MKTILEILGVCKVLALTVAACVGTDVNKFQGKLVSMDPHSVTVMLPDKERTFAVTPETQVTLDDMPAQITDLTAGLPVTIVLTPEARQKSTAAASRVHAVSAE